MAQARAKPPLNEPFLLALASGKGGTGQTMIAANLGVYLAQSGKRVLLVDAKRWGRNLHTFLGIPCPVLTVEALREGEAKQLDEIFVPTPYEKLKLLSGIQETPISAGEAVRPPFLDELKRYPFDYILLDLGSVNSFGMLDHLIWSDRSLLVSVPEPTAVESTYELLRSLYYRLFKTVERAEETGAIVEKAMMNAKDLGIRTPRELVSAIRFFEPDAGDRMAKRIEKFHMHLILNQARSNAEGEIGQGMISVCQRYFGIRISVLGIIDHDSAVPASIRQRKPLHLVQKDAKATKQIEQIAHKLQSQDFKDKREETER